MHFNCMYTTQNIHTELKPPTKYTPEQDSDSGYRLALQSPTAPDRFLTLADG